MANIKAVIQQQLAEEKGRLEQIEVDSTSRKKWIDGWPNKIKEITQDLLSEMTDLEFKSFYTGINDGYIFYTIKYIYRPHIDNLTNSSGFKWIRSILEYDKSLLPELIYQNANKNSIFTSEVFDEIKDDINNELLEILDDILDIQFLVDLDNFKDENEDDIFSASLIMMFNTES
jgi:hypothetical protein